LKVPINDAQIASIAKVYGNKQGDVDYLTFLRDTDCLVYEINAPTSGIKSTYVQYDRDFSGASDVDILMEKVKEFVKRHRIRLGEFFQDHDPLRKGVIDCTKFRTTLYG
jgi:hypothetical protein